MTQSKKVLHFKCTAERAHSRARVGFLPPTIQKIHKVFVGDGCRSLMLVLIDYCWYDGDPLSLLSGNYRLGKWYRFVVGGAFTFKAWSMTQSVKVVPLGSLNPTRIDLAKVFESFTYYHASFLSQLLCYCCFNSKSIISP